MTLNKSTPPLNPTAATDLDVDLQAHFIRMGRSYRDRVSSDLARQHLELLTELSAQKLCRVSARPETDDTLEVTFAAFDYPGELAILCGLLSAEGFTVITGSAYTGEDEVGPRGAAAPSSDVPSLSASGYAREGNTLDWWRRRRAAARQAGPAAADSAPPAGSPSVASVAGDSRVSGRVPPRRILDTFRIRSLDPDRAAPDWAALESRLDELLRLVAAGDWKAARESLIEPVCETIRRFAPPTRSALSPGAEAALLPVKIDLDNDALEHETLIRIESADTPAFLFQLLTAFAMRGIYVRRMDIDTRDGRACDTLAVTDSQFRKLTLSDGGAQLRAAVALVKQFSHLLPSSPNPPMALRKFGEFLDDVLARPDWAADLAEFRRPAALTAVARLMGVSEFLWEDFLRLQHTNLLPMLTRAEPTPRRSLPALRDELTALVAVRQGLDAKTDAINEWKDQQMFRIDMRHILLGGSDPAAFVEFSAEMTDLAEVAVTTLFDAVVAELTARHGPPKLTEHRPCRLCLAALGKTGGCEMGVASDIELMLLFEGDGHTEPPATTWPESSASFEAVSRTAVVWATEWADSSSDAFGDGDRNNSSSNAGLDAGSMPPESFAITNAEFASRVMRELANRLRPRREGIFEIDLRLRPHGEDGPLGVSAPAFAEYYGRGGQAPALLRQALVRLRPIAGDPRFCREVVRLRDRALYEGEPLDIVELRRLRRRQMSELVPVGQTNAKYSPGGLVDIEYAVQALQVKYGRSVPALRAPNTLIALAALRNEHRLSAETADRLRTAYLFLRRLIDALRIVRGHAKDLCLPRRGTDQFAWLARRMDYPPDRPEDTARRFADEIRRTMELVLAETAAIYAREFPETVPAEAPAPPSRAS